MFNRRTFLFMMLATVSALSLANAQDASSSRAPSGLVLRVNDNRISLRTAPSVTALRIGFLMKGEQPKFLERTAEAVTIDAGSDGVLTAPWYRVQTSDGRTGWCFGAYIDKDPLLDLVGEWLLPFDWSEDQSRTLHFRPYANGLSVLVTGESRTQQLRTPLSWDSPPGEYLLDHRMKVAVRQSEDGLLRPAFEEVGIGEGAPFAYEKEAVRIGYWSGTGGPAVQPGRDELDTNGLAAVHRAAQAGNMAEFASLIREGAKPNQLDGNGRTPLYLLLQKNPVPVEAVIQALDLGADPRLEVEEGSVGESALFTVMLRLAHDRRAQRESLYTAMQILLDRGISPNSECGYGEYWAPAVAVAAKDDRMFELLVRAGLRPGDSQGSGGETVQELLLRSGTQGMKKTAGLTP